MKKLTAILATILTALAIGGCSRPADVASRNLSEAADRFEIQRRIVFYNGITDSYMLTLEGLCSLGNYDGHGQLSVTCKTSPTEFKKHFLGLSDNVTYFVEQLEEAKVDTYHYKVTFRPQTIIPDIDVDVK